MNNPPTVSIPENKNGGSKSDTSYYIYIFLIYPCTGLDRPLSLQEVEATRRSRQSELECGMVDCHMLRPPLPPGYISGNHVSHRLSRNQGHSVAGRIKSMKNPNDPLLLVAQCFNRMCHLNNNGTSIQ